MISFSFASYFLSKAVGLSRILCWCFPNHKIFQMPDLNPLYAVFPFLESAPVSVRTALESIGIRATVPAGHFIFREGDSCAQIALILAGRARVYKTDASGREITLYRLLSGESCILTTSSIMSDTAFPAVAVAETDLDVVLIPATSFKYWVNHEPIWQTYVFGLLSNRLAQVMEVVHEVAFLKMDARLAGYLLHRADQDIVAATHETIALELGTSREVVSRLLKALEHEGAVRLTRGVIHIQDPILLKKKT